MDFKADVLTSQNPPCPFWTLNFLQEAEDLTFFCDTQTALNGRHDTKDMTDPRNL